MDAAGLSELKGFRHRVRHAYDLTLRRDRLLELAEIAQAIAPDLPGWCEEFGSKARADGHTYLVFLALTAGLAFIGWRIARGVRARDKTHEPVP